MGRWVIAAFVAACGPRAAPAPRSAAPGAELEKPDEDSSDGATALVRIEYYEERLAKAEREIIGLQRRLDVLAGRQDALVSGAPDTGNTLQKVTARIDWLVSVLNYSESAKSNWWCDGFACLRTESMCNAVAEHGAKPGEVADKCIARRRVYCRAFGKPFIGDRSAAKKSAKDTMTCHPFLSVCEQIANGEGGAPCLGVE